MKPVLLSLILAAACLGQSHTLRSRHYEVTSTADRALTQQVAEHMDLVFEDYEERFAAFRIRNATHVRLHLYETRQEYMDFVASKGFTGANTSGMFLWVDSDAFLTTYVQGQSERSRDSILQHEGFHQFAFVRISDRLPPWIDEGLAEYFGAAMLINGELHTGIVPAVRLRSLQDVVRRGDELELLTLLDMTPQSWGRRVVSGDPKSGLMYAQSWSLAHFFIHAEDGRYRPMLERYLKLISQGRRSKRAFFDAFRTRSINEVEEAWKAWLLDLEPDSLSEAAERLEFLGAGLAALHERDINVATIDELKQRLKAHSFYVTHSGQASTHVLSAENDELFEAPTPERAGDEPPALVLTASDDGLPPSIEVRGLRASVRLEWTRDGERLTRRVVYD